MTHPPGPHLDLDAAADLDEGLLGGAAAASARAHVAQCRQCADAVERLRSTRALLAAMPPETVPADVSSRVDAALEHARNEPRAGGDVVPLGRRRSWNTPAVAGVAAAVAVLVLVGAVVFGSMRSGSSGSAGSGDSAGGVTAAVPRAPHVVKEWSTGRDYTPASLATLVPPLVTGAAPSVAPLTGTAGSSAGGSRGAAPSPSPSEYPVATLRSSPDAVAACGAILSGGSGGLPLAVDFARYNGKAAAIFAFATPGHPESLDVWVVRSTCSQSSLDYYFRRIPRG